MRARVALAAALGLALVPSVARAAEDWLPPRSNAVENVDVPLFKGAAQRIRDRTFQPIALDAAGLVPGFTWSADGATVFIADKAGVVRLVSVPDFRETRRLKFGTPCAQLAMTHCGLVALLPEAQELALVSPRDLRVLRLIKVRAPGRMAAAPASVLAAVVSGGQAVVCNVLEGSVVRTVPGMPPFAFEDVAMSPDGMWVFARCTGFGKWSRFRVQGDAFVFEEEGSRADPEAPCAIDPDSKFLALQHSGSGSTSIVTVKDVDRLCLYSVSDIRTPAVIAPGARLPMAFDAANKCLFASANSTLLQYGMDGRLIKDYALGKRNGLVAMTAHPGGKGLLLCRQEDVWWSPTPAPAPPAEPVVKAVDEPGESARRAAGGVTTVRLAVDAACMAGEAFWSADGQHVVCLTATGTLQKIRLTPKPRTVLRANLGGACTWVSPCADGVLVRVEHALEAWVVGESDFSLKKRIHLPGVGRLVSAPACGSAVAEGPGGTFALLDLQSGQLGLPVPRFTDPAARPVMSPDGHYVFATDMDRAFARYSIDGPELRHEETTPTIGPKDLSVASWVCLSADSRSVALATPMGPAPPAHFPPVGHYGVYVFESGKLATPAVAIAATAPVTAAVVDSAAGRIYAAQSDGRLVWYDMRGKSIGDAQILIDGPPPPAPRPGDVFAPRAGSRQIWHLQAHPKGGQLLARSGTSLFWVTIGPDAPSEPPTPAATAPATRLQSLARNSHAVDDITVTTVQLAAKTENPGRDQNFLWLDGGQYVIIGDPGGTVHKVAVPELVETRVAAVGPIDDMTLSSAAVAVLTTQPRELVLLDAQSLQIRHRIPAASAKHVAASPASPFVFVSEGPRPLYPVAKSTAVFDAARGERLMFTNPGVSGEMRCTPDGKCLVALWGSRLSVFSISGQELRQVSESPSFASPRLFWLGPASDAVYIPGRLPEGKRVTNVDITEFRLPDVRTPARVIPAPSNCERRIDPVSGAVFMQLENGEYVVARPDRPAEQKKYRLTGISLCWRIEAHPQGKGFFLCPDRNVLWAEFGGRAAGRDMAALAAAEAQQERAAAAVGPSAHAAQTGQETLVRGATEDSGAKLVSIGVDVPNLLPCMLWGTEPKHLLLLTQQGCLRMIRMPDCALVKETQLGFPCSAMALARGGLLVARGDMPVIQVLDPVTFQLRRKIAVEHAGVIAAAPAADVAFSGVMERIPFTATPFDTATGKVFPKIDGREVWRESEGRARIYPDLPQGVPGFERFMHMRMTPDGRYLIGDNIDHIHRLRVDGARVTYEERGAKVDVKDVAISADAKYVATVRDRVDGGGKGGRELNLVRVFAVGDLQKPALSIELSSRAANVAIASPGGRVFTDEGWNTVGVYGTGGKRLGGVKMPWRRDRILQLLPSQTGFELLVLGDGALVWVDTKEAFR